MSEGNEAHRPRLFAVLAEIDHEIVRVGSTWTDNQAMQTEFVCWIGDLHVWLIEIFPEDSDHVGWNPN